MPVALVGFRELLPTDTAIVLDPEVDALDVSETGVTATELSQAPLAGQGILWWSWWCHGAKDFTRMWLIILLFEGDPPLLWVRTNGVGLKLPRKRVNLPAN